MKREYRLWLRKLFVPLALLLATNYQLPATRVALGATGIYKQINFQGRLTDASDNLLTGTYYVCFSVYDAESGGSKLWPASTPTPTSVTVTNGVFSTTIGSADAMTLDFNDDAYYLNVYVNDSSSCSSGGEDLSPRQRITSAAYAFNTDTVDGIHAATSATPNQLIALDADKDLELGAGDVNATDASFLGSVGIGTSSPNAKLEVAGNIILGTDSTSDDDYLYFDDGSTEYLMWDDDPGQFVLTDDLVPSAADTYNLGSTTAEWNALYLGDDAGVYFGADQDWSFLYDETTDDRLELASSGSGGVAILSTGALSANDLFALNWSPGSAQTLTGDLFSINTNSNATVTGNLLGVYDNSSTVFTVSPTQITSAVPHSFTASGDVSIAYDLIFTNQTSAAIQSYGPFTIEVGESFESNDLTLKTYNAGSLIIESSNLWADGILLGIGTTAPASRLSVAGGVGIGTTSPSSVYHNTAVAPDGGLIIEGSVGIGTTAPSSTLTVAGTVESTGLKMTTSPGAGYVLTSDGDGVASWADLSGSGGPWTLNSLDLYPDDTSYNVALGATEAGTAKLYVNGNVGIGTTAPNALLELASTASTLRLTDTTASAKSLLITTDGDLSQFEEAGGSADDLLVLDLASSRVGIGTTSPGYKLDVNGDIRIASGSDLYVGTYGLNDNSSANSGASLVGLYDDSMTYVASDTTVQGAIKELDTAIGSVSSTAGGWTDGGSYVYLTTSDDSVGIGTSSPSTKLEVAGSFKATDGTFTGDVQVSGGQFAIGGTTPTANIGILDSQNNSTAQYRYTGDNSAIFDIYGSSDADTTLDILNSRTSRVVAVSIDGDVTIASGKDLHIGSIGLADVGSSTTSGAYLIGLYDDSMTYISANTTVQGAIKELDTAIGTVSSTAGGWTDGGSYVYLTTSDDSVGIGTSSPSTKLEVAGSFKATDGTFTGDVQVSGGQFAIGGTTPTANIGILDSQNNSTAQYRYTGDNSAIFDIYGSSDADTTLDILNSRSGRAVNVTIDGTLTATGGITGVIDGSGTENYLPKFSDSNTLGNSALYDSSGSIGIGTTAPGAKLEVAGNIILGTDSTSDDDYLYFDDGSTEYLMWDDDPGQFVLTDDLILTSNLGSTTTEVTNVYLGDDGGLYLGADQNFLLAYDETTDDKLELGDGTNTFLSLSDQGAVANFAFNTNDLYIDSASSHTGVGNTAPYGFDLQVAGNIGGNQAPAYSTITRTLSDVDSNYGAGMHTSIAVAPDGLPVISHYDYANYQLRVCKCTNSSCTSATCTAIDTAYDYGEYSSIAIGSDGLPIVAHHDWDNDYLRVCKCNNTACSSASCTSQDTAVGDGQNTSVAIGSDGLPIIAHQDYSAAKLRVCKCSNNSCTSNSCYEIESSASYMETSMTILIGPDSLPLILHLSASGGYPRVCKCSDTSCSSASCNTVDSNANNYKGTSMAIGVDGLPIVASYLNSSGDLRVCKCSDGACSSATCTNIDTANVVGIHPSIAIGPDGLPVIAHYDSTNYSLRVCKCSNISCTSATCNAVDSGGLYFGEYSSIAIGQDGLPIISYYDGNTTMKVAKCANPDCSASSATALAGGSMLGGWMANPRSYSVPFQSTNTIQVSNPTTFANLSFLTAGSEKMTITPYGRVGIGTTAPSSQMSVLGTASQLSLAYDSSNYQTLTVLSDGALTIAQDGGAASFALKDGNVGVGTTSPTGKLQVVGDEVRIGDGGTVNYATGDGDLYVEDALEVDGSVYFVGASSLIFGGTTNLAETTSSTDSGAYLVGLYDDSMTYIAGDTTVQGAIKQLDTAIGTVSSTAGGWTDGGSYVYLTTSDDSVGIGTSSPSTKLEVAGSFKATDGTFTGDVQVSGGQFAIGGTTPTANIGILDSQNNSTAQYRYTGDNSAIFDIYGSSDSDTTLDILNSRTSRVVAVSIDGDVTIASGKDLHIGSIGLADVGSSTTSGAYLIGLYDDSMSYISANTTVQGAIKELDTAIGTVSSTAGGWTDGGTDVYLTTDSDSVGIGTSAPNAKLEVAGNIILGTDSTSDDDYLYFDDGSTEYLMWDDDPGQFVLTDDLVPSAADALNLGSATAEWNALYLGDDAGVYFGQDQNFLLAYDETTDDKLELSDGTNTFLSISDQGSDADFTFTADDMTVRLGDTAGVNKVSIADSSSVEVAAIDSDGMLRNSSIMDQQSTAPTNVTDSSGNSNHGTTTGSPIYTDGKFVKSIEFDGKDDYVSSAYSSVFDFGTGSFTVEGFFKNTVASTKQIARFSSGGWKIYTNSSNYLCFGIDDDATFTPTDYACDTAARADNAWHHFAAVKNSTTGIYLYIDGLLVGSDESLGDPGSLSGSSPTLYLGIDSDGSSTPHKGGLDEIRISNTNRYTANFNPPTAPFTSDSNTVGLWHFDEGNRFMADTTFGDDIGVEETLRVYGNSSWWSNSYSARRKIRVVNNSGDTLAEGTSTSLSINTKQLYYKGMIKSDGDDLRVVYQDPTTKAWTELDRQLVSAGNYDRQGTAYNLTTSEATTISFKIPKSIASGSGTSSFDTNYYLYYGNPNASTYDSDRKEDSYNVLASLDTVYFYDASATTYNDQTTEAGTAYGTPFTLLETSSDYAYFGHDSKFYGIDFALSQKAVGAGSADWEYWNGAAWTNISAAEDDNTSNFTKDGAVTWTDSQVSSWATTDVNSVTKYWVRVIMSSSATTVPKAYHAKLSKNALLVCPFDGSTTCANAETPSTETGALRYQGNNTAIELDGSDDYVTSGGNFGSSATKVTVEAWIYLKKSLSNHVSIIGKDSGSGGSNYCSGSTWSIGLAKSYPGTGFILPMNDGSCQSATGGTLSTGAWTHIAGTYDGSTIKYFINGVLTASTSYSGSANLGYAWRVGDTWSSNALPAVIVDEVRISSNVRYANDFTPPTAPFVRDEHTKLLLHFDENGDDPRNTGKAIDDSGLGNHGTITGAKYVDAQWTKASSGTYTLPPQSQAYAAHRGIFVEEATTNKITNPSFDYTADWDAGWDAVGANLTLTQETTAPYYKFGASSAKLVAAGTGDNNFTIGIDPDSTATHTLSAYVYNGTSGAVGGTMDNTVAQLVWEGAAQSTTTYTDMGGGWWRLTYSAATTDATNEYGLYVLDTKTVYLDAVQLEALAYATTYCDGDLDLSTYGGYTGASAATYTWSGTSHNSTSSRVVTNFKYASSGNINANKGSLSFWIKAQEAITAIAGDQYLFDIYSDASNRIAVYMDASEDDMTLNTNGTETSSTGTTVAAGAWVNFVLTYDFDNDQYKLYRNGNATPIISTTTSLSTPTLGTNFVLGGDNANANKFNGTISDWRAFSDIFTTTEVADIYYQGLTSHQQEMDTDNPGAQFAQKDAGSTATGELYLAGSISVGSVKQTMNDTGFYTFGGSPYGYFFDNNMYFGAMAETIDASGFSMDVSDGVDVFVADNLGVEGDIYLDGTLYAHSLGSASAEIDSIYLGDDAGIYFGQDQNAHLYYDEASDDRLELTGTAFDIDLSGAFSLDSDSTLTLGGTRLVYTSDLAAGSVATEAISLKSSVDLNADDELLQIGDGGGDFLTILGNGNVGIGTTAPGKNLDVWSSSNQAIRASDSTGNGRIELGYDSTSNYGRIQVWLAPTGAQALALQPSGGNVGIGTTSPTHHLDVNGRINSQWQFFYSDFLGYDYLDASGSLNFGGLYYNKRGTGGQVNSTSATDGVLRILTGATGGNAGEINCNDTDPFDDALNPLMEIKAYDDDGDDLLTAMNAYIGFSDRAGSDTGDPTNGVFFRRADDANWYAVTRAASTETTTDTGIAPSTTARVFRIEYGTSSVKFYIDGVLKATHTTNIPTTNTDLDIYCHTTGANQKKLYIDYLKIWQDPPAPGTAGSASGESKTFGLEEGADLAEAYPVSDASVFAQGNIVSADTTKKGYAVASLTAYEPTLLGVVSTSPGLRLGDFSSDKHIPVALVGRVPVTVSDTNGPIAAGDSITSSSLLGIGMKATQSGKIVGRALEPFDPATGQGEGESCPPEAPAGTHCGKILVVLEVGWEGRELVTLAEDWEVVGAKVVNQTTGEVLESVLAKAAGVFASLRSGLVTTVNLLADTVLVKDKIISPLAEFDFVQARQLEVSEKFLSPLAEIGEVKAAKIQVSEKFTSPVADIEELTAGTIKAKTIEADELRVGKVTAKEIVTEREVIKETVVEKVASNQNLVAGESTTSSQLAASYQLPATQPTTDSWEVKEASFSAQLNETLARIDEILGNQTTPESSAGAQLQSAQSPGLADLTVFGQTSLGPTSVAGPLVQDGTLLINRGEQIDNIYGDLYLQRLGRGSLNIQNGAVIVDEEGRLLVAGGMDSDSLAALDLTPKEFDSLVESEAKESTLSAEAIREGWEEKLAALVEKIRRVFEVVNPEGRVLAFIDNTGKLFARRVETEILSPVADKDLVIRLGSVAGSPTPATSYQPPATTNGSSKLDIQNSQGESVASIDAEGKVKAAEVEVSKLRVSPAVEADGSSGPSAVGQATLAVGQKEAFVANSSVTTKSLIFVTPTSSTAGQSLYVAYQEEGIGFWVRIDKAVSVEIEFNWWVVN